MTTSALANVTNTVYDFMFVEITEPSLCDHEHVFDYLIYSPDERPVRKGSFSGPSVQLRLSLIEAGNYLFRLYLNGEALQNFCFEKKPTFAMASA